MSYYIHNVKGRVRLKTPIVKKNEGMAERVKDFILHLRGIKSVTVNIVTGSVLINYDSQIITKDSIVTALESEGYFDARKALNHDQLVHHGISRFAEGAGKLLFGIAAGKVLEDAGLSFVAALI